MPGRKIMLLARRVGAEIRFSLRAGVGSPVERAPWKEEWGGGASVENPHFQRVKYCELLVSNSFDVPSDCIPHSNSLQACYLGRLSGRGAKHTPHGLYVCRAVDCLSANAIGARLPYTCSQQKISINRGGHENASSSLWQSSS